MMVRVHPCMDLFMRGVAVAEIEKVGRKWMYLWHACSVTRHRVSKKRWGDTIVADGEQFPDQFRE